MSIICVSINLRIDLNIWVCSAIYMILMYLMYPLKKLAFHDVDGNAHYLDRSTRCKKCLSMACGLYLSQVFP